MSTSLKVTVPAQVLRTNVLPTLGICPRHGLPATTTARRKYYTSTPIWVVVLALASLLVGAIVALVIRKEVSGDVPGCGQCKKVRTRFRLAVAGSWAALFALLFVLASAVPDSGVAFGTWFLLMLVVLFGSFTGAQWRVRGVLSRDQLWLELKGVHPAFVQAAQQAMQQAAQPPVYAGHPPTPLA